MSLVTKIKESLDRQLTLEEIELAKKSLPVEASSGSFKLVDTYTALASGYRKERIISCGDAVLEAEFLLYNNEAKLTVRKTIFYEEGVPGTTYVEEFEPPGCFFGKARRSEDGVFYRPPAR